MLDANQRREAGEPELYAAHAKVERTIAALDVTRSAIKGTLPLAAAEALMDGIEDHFDNIRVALTQALRILKTAIDAIEWTKSAAPKTPVGAV